MKTSEQQGNSRSPDLRSASRESPRGSHRGGVPVHTSTASSSLQLSSLTLNSRSLTLKHGSRHGAKPHLPDGLGPNPPLGLISSSSLLTGHSSSSNSSLSYDNVIGPGDPQFLAQRGPPQSATTLTSWPWARTARWCSGTLLTPTAPCSWASTDSLLSLETPPLLCRVSPRGTPRPPSRVSSRETPPLLFKGWCRETLPPKAWRLETSPLRVWPWEIWPLTVFETASVTPAPRAWHLRSRPRATTASQRPSWRLSTRGGRWMRGTGCSASKPDLRRSTARTWGSMTSPAGGAYRRTTSDLQAPGGRLLPLTAPGSSWWARASSATAWGPRPSPAPPRRLWLEAPKPPALLCRAAAAAACRAKAGPPPRPTAPPTDRTKASPPRQPPCPGYPPPPPPPTPRMPPPNGPRSRTPRRGRTRPPWEPWNKKRNAWMNHLCSLSVHSSRILCK